MSDTRKTTAAGHLRPLEDRMSKRKMERRALKMEARHTVAQELFKQNAITRGITMSVLGRKFWGRLKWLVLGK